MRSRREQVVTGVAAVLILGLALWLLLGRSPGPTRTTVDLGQEVATDAGRVTVLEVVPVPPGNRRHAPPEPGHTLVEIRFRSCRSDPNGPVVELSRFGCDTAGRRSGGGLADGRVDRDVRFRRGVRAGPAGVGPGRSAVRRRPGRRVAPGGHPDRPVKGIPDGLQLFQQVSETLVGTGPGCRTLVTEPWRAVGNRAPRKDKKP